MTCVNEGDLQWGGATSDNPIGPMYPLLNPVDWDLNVDVIFEETYAHGKAVKKLVPAPAWKGVLHEHVILDIPAIGTYWDITNHLQVEYKWVTPPGPGVLAHARVIYDIERARATEYPSDMTRNTGQLHIYELDNGKTQVWFSKAALFPDPFGIYYCWAMEVTLQLGAWALANM
jgi:hypothetical protein